MERGDDPLFEMRDSWQLRHRCSFEPPAIDDGTARRVLDGLDPADVPPAYAEAARSLAMMRGPGQPDELASEAAVVAAFAARVAQPFEPAAASRRLSGVSRIARPKLATAGIAGGLALTGGLAAAATGSLPGPAQSIVAETLGGIGIHVPHSNSHAHGQPRPARGGSATGTNSQPPSAGGAPDSTTPGLATPVGGIDNTPCATASAGHCQAAQSGAGSNPGPAVSVPNPGGTGTANTASNGASLNGTTKANSASGGASGAGSGNATAHGGSNAPTPPSGAGSGNTTSHGGSTTATNATSGASGAGPPTVTAHPGFSPTNTTHAGLPSGGPATAARGAP